MKKFLFNTFLVGTLSLFLYPLIIIATDIPEVADFSNNFREFKEGGSGYSWTRLREADTIKNIDVLILGSSRAYSSIDPRALDSLKLRSFNLGSSAQTPIQTYYLLERYLDQFNPKVIIWDVDPFTLTDHGLEPFLDVLTNCRKCESLISMVFEVNKLEGYNAFLKSLFRTSEKSSFIEVLSSDKDIYLGRGFVRSKKNNFDERKIEFTNLYFKNNQINAFENALKYIKIREIPVLLVLSPLSRDTFIRIKKMNDYSNIYEQMVLKGLANEYVDFNNIIQLPNDFFFDPYHLNQKGVIEYNKVFFKYFTLNLEGF